VERFRRREVEPEGHSLRDRLADWLEPQADHLAACRPALPDELDDRAQDVWEVLLAVTDLASGDWPEKARRAAVALSSGDEREDESLTATLLRDVYAFFSSNGHDRVRTADLLAYLHSVEESPWGDWYGKGLSAHGLSRLLKPYRIKTMPVRVGGETTRGYKVEQFADAFARAVSVTGVTGVTSNGASQAGRNARNARNGHPAGERLGGEMFPVVLANAVRDGHITEPEAEARYAVHKVVCGQ
jgi:hypothetical protein